MVFFVIILDVRGYGSHDVIMRISWENDYCICDVLIEHSSPFFSLLLLQQGYLSIAESQRRGKKKDGGHRRGQEGGTSREQCAVNIVTL